MQQQGAGREGFTQLGERRRNETTGRMIRGIIEKVWENMEKKKVCNKREKGKGVQHHGEEAGKVGRREKV